MSVFFIFAAIRFNMIVIIGADGFLGGSMAAKLRDAEARHTILGIELVQFTDTDEFFQFLPLHYREVEWVIYCDKRIPNAALSVFRFEFVQKLWTVAARYSVPLLYAFHQSMEQPESDFNSDRFVVWSGRQYRRPPFWYIFKVGEIYGPKEDVDREQTSRIFSFYQQIVTTGKATILQTEQDNGNAGTTRDYLYVQDAVRVFYWFMQHRPANGVYDLGSGFERTDLAVVNAIFRTLKLSPQIQYPLSQPFFPDGSSVIFKPDLSNLRRVGYKKPFFSVENGIKSSLRRLSGAEKPVVSRC